jgi:ketosteroid isomerase-like protein
MMNRFCCEERVRRAALALVCAVALAGTALAQPAVDPGKEVREANIRRFAAMVRADSAELDRLLADDLTYVHSTGELNDRTQFLASISSKTTQYRSIEPGETDVRVYGDTAVVTGRAAMKVTAKGQDLSFVLQYTAVYVRREGLWKLAAWQSTRLPEAAGQ